MKRGSSTKKFPKFSHVVVILSQSQTKLRKYEIHSWELRYPLEKEIFEDDFPFSKVRYVSSLEGNLVAVGQAEVLRMKDDLRNHYIKMR